MAAANRMASTPGVFHINAGPVCAPVMCQLNVWNDLYKYCTIVLCNNVSYLRALGAVTVHDLHMDVLTLHLSHVEQGSNQPEHQIPGAIC